MELLGEGATVPFIARYRKEKTGGLDDTQLRKLEERLGYLRELEDRRATVLKTIEEQGKLTPELARSINAAETKVELEDLYAPYKPKRRTKAQIAREAGLEPLADALLANPALAPDAEAAKFIDADKGVADAKAALEGARHILIERMGEEPRLVGTLREWEWGEGVLASKVHEGQGRRRAPSSPTISSSASASRTCLRTGRWPCCAAATRACSISISTWRTRRVSPIPPKRRSWSPSASPNAGGRPTRGSPRRRGWPGRASWPPRSAPTCWRG